MKKIHKIFCLITTKKNLRLILWKFYINIEYLGKIFWSYERTSGHHFLKFSKVSWKSSSKIKKIMENLKKSKGLAYEGGQDKQYSEQADAGSCNAFNPEFESIVVYRQSWWFGTHLQTKSAIVYRQIADFVCRLLRNKFNVI